MEGGKEKKTRKKKGLLGETLPSTIISPTEVFIMHNPTD
jgi:hypothetical protein